MWLSGCNEGVEARLRCGAAHAGRSSVSDVTAAAGKHEEHGKGRARGAVGEEVGRKACDLADSHHEECDYLGPEEVSRVFGALNEVSLTSHAIKCMYD